LLEEEEGLEEGVGSSAEGHLEELKEVKGSTLVSKMMNISRIFWISPGSESGFALR
jgi:hypothetical protein